MKYKNIILGGLIVMLLVALALMLAYGPGSPNWNYAGSHEQVEDWSVCGPYYENLTVAEKYERIVKVEGKTHIGKMVLGTDGIERETGERLYPLIDTGKEYQVISIDDSCGRMDHRVLILGVKKS